MISGTFTAVAVPDITLYPVKPIKIATGFDFAAAAPTGITLVKTTADSGNATQAKIVLTVNNISGSSLLTLIGQALSATAGGTAFSWTNAVANSDALFGKSPAAGSATWTWWITPADISNWGSWVTAGSEGAFRIAFNGTWVNFLSNGTTGGGDSNIAIYNLGANNTGTVTIDASKF